MLTNEQFGAIFVIVLLASVIAYGSRQGWFKKKSKIEEVEEARAEQLVGNIRKARLAVAECQFNCEDLPPAAQRRCMDACSAQEGDYIRDAKRRCLYECGLHDDEDYIPWTRTRTRF